jgi:hypothetical protein
MTTLLAISQHNGVRAGEVGFALLAISGVAFAIGAVSSWGRRNGNLVGGILLALGAVVIIFATHWGHFG